MQTGLYRNQVELAAQEAGVSLPPEGAPRYERGIIVYTTQASVDSRARVPATIMFFSHIPSFAFGAGAGEAGRDREIVRAAKGGS